MTNRDPEYLMNSSLFRWRIRKGGSLLKGCVYPITLSSKHYHCAEQLFGWELVGTSTGDHIDIMALGGTIVAGLLVALLFYQTIYWLYLVYFHPLASYPGPGLARFTNYW